MEFKLDIKGVEGVYTGFLTTLDGETVAELEGSSVSRIRKDAQAYAAQYKSETRPSRLETYTEQFTL